MQLITQLRLWTNENTFKATGILGAGPVVVCLGYVNPRRVKDILGVTDRELLPLSDSDIGKEGTEHSLHLIQFICK